MSDSIEVYLGVDVSKMFVDVCALDGEGRVLWQGRAPRSAAALAGVAARFEGRPALAVMEATGKLEDVPALALEACGVGVSVQNPAKMRHYALGRGLLEKSDKIDRRMLAEYGRERRPKPRVRPDPAAVTLAAVTARRRQLVALRASEKTRLRGEVTELTRQSLLELIEHLSMQIERIEQEIQNQLRACEHLWARYKLLMSAPGVGKTTAAELVATMPELGSLSRGEAGKLAGLAPLVKQSGELRGRAMIQGGRAVVRNAMYMAALTASRYDTWFRDRYQGMVDSGKAKKAALVALGRQLLVILNHMVRNRRSFDPSLLPPLRG